jgi:hypothetical protein
MNPISNETTLGKFIENNLNETYDSWLKMTPIEFLKKFWTLNSDKISPDYLSIFFDNLENSDDTSFKYTSIEELLNTKRPIIPFLQPIKALDLWNSKLNSFIYEFEKSIHKVPQLFHTIRILFLNSPIPLSYHEFYDDHPDRVYFKLMNAIPIDQCRWFWDKYHRMVFQIDNHIYFQKYTNNFSCIIMGKIEDDFTKSSFDTVCNIDEFEKLEKKIYKIQANLFYPEDEYYDNYREERDVDNPWNMCQLL